MTDAVSAIVLAGGASRRLGQDKRAIRISSPETLLDQTVARLAALSDDLIIVGSASAPVVRDPRARVVFDDGSGRGPLVGIVTGLSVATNDYSVVVACDLPFLSVVALRTMLECPRGYDLLVPRRPDGTLEMLHAVYHKNCLALAHELLDAERLKLGGLAMALARAGRAVQFLDDEFFKSADPQLTTFFNVNTIDDLAAARIRSGPRDTWRT